MSIRVFFLNCAITILQYYHTHVCAMFDWFLSGSMNDVSTAHAEVKELTDEQKDAVRSMSTPAQMDVQDFLHEQYMIQFNLCNFPVFWRPRSDDVGMRLWTVPCRLLKRKVLRNQVRNLYSSMPHECKIIPSFKFQWRLEVFRQLCCPNGQQLLAVRRSRGLSIG